jgi:hypothetical protein
LAKGTTQLGPRLARALLVLTCLASSAKAIPAWSETAAGSPPAPEEGPGADAALRPQMYLPFAAKSQPCEPIPWEVYGLLSVLPPATSIPAEEHPDLNLSWRGYKPTQAYLGLVDYGGSSDPNLPPQLPGLFADNRTGSVVSVYQVYDWDWQHDRRGQLLTNPVVTLAGLFASPGETVHVPPSGYSIGSGYEVLVLFASPQRITLKYTREDNVVHGYTLHLEGVCVEPRLVALYNTWNSSGRQYLPALRASQALGRAQGGEVQVAIRDSGTFLDPRSRKDWWRGR